LTIYRSINAFWDGQQLVFGDGDGDGRIFDRFTRGVDILGHEFTHAVTERSAGLAYQGQSGALNESISDVFGSCLKQRLLGQTVVEADWLIGAGSFLPGVAARGIRDMANPGTAYDDPRLGMDPQPAHFDDYVDTSDDNGGVHVNSGIPNRAFQLAADAIGGNSWEGAGAIWYAALAKGDVNAATDFSGFAACVAAAGARADLVDRAWRDVGVDPGTPPPPQQQPSLTEVEVRRSGGLIGRTVVGRVDLDGDDERAAEVRALIPGAFDGGFSTANTPGAPDRFSYCFQLPVRPGVTIAESDLTPELRRLAQAVLGDAR
jgi:hypothetical protein